MIFVNETKSEIFALRLEKAKRGGGLKKDVRKS